MNYYAIVNGINALCALAIAVIIALRKAKRAAPVAYAYFYLLLFAWASMYFMWGIQTDRSSSLYWLRLLEFPVCYIHVAFFHFCLAFSNNLKSHKRTLYGGYLLSTFFVFVNFRNGFFELNYIRDKDPFRWWPHGTPWLSAFITFQIVYVTLSLWILYRSIKISEEPFRTKLKLFLSFCVIGWTGGMANWFYFYDATPIPPIGNPAVTFYILATAYLIFKHDLLGLNIVFRKAYVYALLTLMISLIYALFIVIFERLFQTYLGYRSFLMSILAAMTIALLFNPLRSVFNKLIDRVLFGKGIEQLSTENVFLRHELQHQDRLKAVATLAAGMAHEIKNPLTAIKIFAEHLPTKYNDPDFRDKFKGVMVKEVDRVNNIVQQLLDFSKPKDLELKPDSVKQILEETLNLLNSSFLSHRIEVVRDYKTDPKLLVDRNQLKQAFLNLLLNAIQAMPEGGTLTVSTFLNGKDDFVVSIADTGVGIPEDQLAHIFDPFYTTKEGGTGLGLSIVHGIVTRHGGKIRAQNNNGPGANFRITLTK